MATVTLTRGTTLPDSSAKADFHNLIDNATGTVSGIVTADISSTAGIVGTQIAANAAIADTQLATISTAGKVNTSALTTTSAAAGDVLYHNGTNWVRLAKDAGKYLQSGASDVAWATVTAGLMKQVVNVQSGAVATGSTALPSDDTIPQNTEGDQYMTLAITPTSATNKLKIEVVVYGYASSGNIIGAALFQDSTAGALAAGRNAPYAGAAYCGPIVFTHYMTSGTTSETTFKVRAGGVSGTFTFNGEAGSRLYGGVMASSITITEITV